VSLDPEPAAHAVAAAGDAIVTVDHSANVTSWNLAAERLLGFSREYAISRGLALNVPAEYRARHVAAFHAAMELRPLGGSPVEFVASREGSA
jgi:PAS domain S-box-containing protein